jgi:small subunit ribosomal protein S8
MDQIANMLNGIKNAGTAQKELVQVPFSKFKLQIAEALKESGYVKAVRQIEDGSKKSIEIVLAYKNKDHAIHGVKRVSKPSKRVYIGVKDIRPVKFGSGALFISTPKGVMSEQAARKEMVGGEALFEIW